MASVDRGKSVQIANDPKIVPGNGIQGILSTGVGVYESYFTQGIDDRGRSVALTDEMPATTGGGGMVKYYKMTGYYVTGAVYESFVVTINPTPATTTNPNTGHTLTNTFVSSFWEA